MTCGNPVYISACVVCIALIYSLGLHVLLNFFRDSDNDDLENSIRVNMTYVLKEKSIERPLGWYNPGNCKAEFKRIKTNFTEKNDM